MTKIEDWLGVEFVSSSNCTPQYNSFYKVVSAFIKKELSDTFEIKLNKGHFYFSGFAMNKNTKKWMYFSCSDVRFFPDQWYFRLLVRTAKNDKDFTGGINNQCMITSIRQFTNKLTEG